MVQYIDNQSTEWILTWPDIASHLGVSVSTARRWARLHDLPIARLPDGRACTTRNLVEQWLFARVLVQREAAQDTPGKDGPV